MSAEISKARPKGQAAKAAAAEQKPEPKQIEFRGLTLELPATMPATIMFDLTELEVAQENAMPYYRMLRSILGGEQFNAIRNAVSDDEDASDVIAELLNLSFEQYGVTLGESSASQGS